MNQDFDSLYNELLLEMARNQIFLINERQLADGQKRWLKEYFRHNVLQFITPTMLSSQVDLVQFMQDDYTYLVVEMRKDQDIQYALIEILRSSSALCLFAARKTAPP